MNLIKIVVLAGMLSCQLSLHAAMQEYRPTGLPIKQCIFRFFAEPNYCHFSRDPNPAANTFIAELHERLVTATKPEQAVNVARTILTKPVEIHYYELGGPVNYTTYPSLLEFYRREHPATYKSSIDLLEKTARDIMHDADIKPALKRGPSIKTIINDFFATAALASHAEHGAFIEQLTERLKASVPNVALKAAHAILEHPVNFKHEAYPSLCAFYAAKADSFAIARRVMPKLAVLQATAEQMVVIADNTAVAATSVIVDAEARTKTSRKPRSPHKPLHHHAAKPAPHGLDALTQNFAQLRISAAGPNAQYTAAKEALAAMHYHYPMHIAAILYGLTFSQG